MSRDYPVAYRRGSARHDNTRLSTGGGGSALDQALRETVRQNRAEAALREAIRETNRRHEQPGKTRVPRNVRRSVLERGGRVALKRFPLASLLKQAVAMLQTDAITQGHAYSWAPGLGASGVCPIVDVLDYSDQRSGLPSTTCQVGQAVGPGYSAHWGLGVGHWVKRAFGFNYNQLRWWLPSPHPLPVYDAIIRKAGFTGTSSPQAWGMADATMKYDPLSNPRISAPNVGAKPTPSVHPHWDPFYGTDVMAYQPPPIPLQTELVTNRDGEGPGVANERSSWQFGLAVQPLPERLSVRSDQRPGRGEKERKAVVGRALLRLMGMLTEELDALAAVYDCIPKQLRERESKGPQGWEAMQLLRELGRLARENKRGSDQWHAIKDRLKGRGKISVQDKAELVYKYWDQIDLRCVAFNLLWERIEDATYAKISKHSKNPFASKTRTVSGGRALEFSRQGEGDTPLGSLPLGDLKSYLEGITGWRS